MKMICSYCKKEYEISKGVEKDIKKNPNKSRYCSRVCLNAYLKEKNKKETSLVKCLICNKEFQLSKDQAFRYRKGEKDFYCSRTCTAKYANSKMNYNDRTEKLRECFKENKEEIVNKRKATCLIKYGEDNPFKIKSVKIKCNTKEVILKAHESKKKNNTYGKSKIEDILYNYLCKEFGECNVIRQYVVDGINFDFKIIRPSLKPNHKGELIEQLIELHGSYFHNYRPFIDCEEHIKEYDSMIKKGGLSANIANKWRYTDIAKINYCKLNNLNYTAIYFDNYPKPYYTNEQLKDCWNRICKQKSKYTNMSSNNEIINNYCYKEIYKENFNKFNNTDLIMNYLINRIKYANDYGYGQRNITLLNLLKDFNKSR